MKLKEWLADYSGSETEARELAESLVSGPDDGPAVSAAKPLCEAARKLLSAFKEFDAELERVGFGD